MGNYLKASDISRWKVVKPRPLMLDDGVVFSPNAISSPNKRVMHISTKHVNINFCHSGMVHRSCKIMHLKIVALMSKIDNILYFSS